VHICIVTHNIVKGDGQGRVNYEIVAEGLRRNHRLTLIATRVAAEFESHPLVEWIPIGVDRWPTQLVRNQVFAAKSSWKLWLRRKQFDLVIMNGFINWLGCDINNIHFVHSSWLKSPVHPSRLNNSISGWYQYLFTWLNARLEKQAFSKADILVPVSRKVQQELEAIGCPPSKIKVIANGVDLDEYNPIIYPWTPDRAELGLPEQVPLALFAGDIKTTRKNLDTVLKALTHVGDLHLAVAGDTTDSPFPAMAHRMGIGERVHFLGYRRDLAEIMKRVDFFVFPTRFEACSLVVLEAMAAGLPVITTYESGSSELIDIGDPERKAGFVMEHPDDLPGLVNAMTVLTREAGVRLAMGEAARRNVTERSWKTITSAYMALYEETAERKAGKRTGERHHDGIGLAERRS